MDISKLDTVFSEYIRRRDVDEFGRVKCCTCDMVTHWSEMDAGHFVSRKHLATRWNEQNVHSQCPECNRLGDGKLKEYANYLVERYFITTPRKLKVLSRATYKPMQHEIDEMVQIYKDKIKELDNQLLT